MGRPRGIPLCVGRWSPAGNKEGQVMRNISVLGIVAVAAGISFGAELPICEEFSGEKVECVREGDRAVIVSREGETVTYEFFVKDRKGVVELKGDVAVFARSYSRKLELERMPVDAERQGEYTAELMSAVLDDIGW